MMGGLPVPVHWQNQAEKLNTKTPNALPQRLSDFIQYVVKHNGVPNSQKSNVLETKTILGHDWHTQEWNSTVSVCKINF